ncbi:MAG TPA: 50S ribosomal protein L10, partial [Candidatus Omnitrophica bacterium]|nr:50S ribosomal protein L10 [Candidatus Omnitrophota bacterium]
MERIGRIYRSTLEKEFKKRLADTNSLFIVRYAGVKSSELTKLRNNLSQNNGKLFIAKNSLANRVLKEVDMKGLVDLLGGQTAFVFGYDDPIAICKIISAFIKEHKALEFQGGI